MSAQASPRRIRRPSLAGNRSMAFEHHNGLSGTFVANRSASATAWERYVHNLTCISVCSVFLAVLFLCFEWRADIAWHFGIDRRSHRRRLCPLIRHACPAKPLSLNRALDVSDDDLLHREHGSHGSRCLGVIWILHKLEKPRGGDLPGYAKLVG